MTAETPESVPVPSKESRPPSGVGADHPDADADAQADALRPQKDSLGPVDEAGLRAERALTAQILATEHWSLLASRSTTQSEVLTRIAIFLTLFSAGLLGIGLLGQATDFSGWFGTAALGILAFIWLVGFLTQVRVMNVSDEDMMYVVAMNRIRGAYHDLKPGIVQNFLASVHDDEAGVRQTYSFFRARGLSQFVAAAHSSSPS